MPTAKQKKQTNPKPGGEAAHQYVIALTSGLVRPLQDLLSKYSGVKVLTQLDDQTALVEMPDRVEKELSAQNPDLVVERNLPYQLHSAEG
jgi:hypothetical protein